MSVSSWRTPPPPHVMDSWGARALRWLSVLFCSRTQNDSTCSKSLTGFAMIQIMAFGQNLAQPSAKSLTIDAFVLKRSSLVIPMRAQKKRKRKWQASYFCQAKRGWQRGILNKFCDTDPVLLYAQNQIRALLINLKAEIPGFLGTPAGITTTSAPVRHASRDSGPSWPETCERSKPKSLISNI